ncbi:xanthine dehydrogenase family protein molybdopterin-binding subunit [Paractinoplanes brasiliensis]|uniref:Xanthine dehydrogenase YagR molybdenum-binding subunit n=1 Tax=Paractinoplanes brasiliensis TaxID=52695 RepID=A0A4R6JZC8_9ACTN|nr:xanthine dehydrogenase family protein molybdopterin-binding subunit [Actinoplanes brasiliensis]TDO41262.1 xanthine dehydrogenase YagR molybdenum-binding subunit [Actinoplanes brasiliensis]GID27456.1 carbon-monoxide dehydrogenase large subunit [Actinoplanes brasiliensis]
MAVSPVGREIDRVDGRKKVTGQATYAADHKFENLAYAYVVTSTVPRGRIKEMDISAALGAPGVLDVYNPDKANNRNLGLTMPSMTPPLGHVENYPPLEDWEIRYRGQAIAVVVAETFEQARDAAGLITTTYETTPARLSMEDNSPGVPASIPGFPPFSFTKLAPGVASIDAALAASEVVIESSFHQPVQHHVAMEPHAAVVTWEGKERVTIYTGSQSPVAAQLLLAGRLGLPPANTRIVCTYTGGGFGSRVMSWNDAILAAGAARKLGRPVKLVMAREQVFTMVGHRGHVNQTVKLGASRSGVLTVVSHDCDAERPAVGGWPLLPAREVSDSLYKTPNLHVAQRFVELDMPPTWAMRGPNEAPGAFAIETAMDELAVATGVDPVELRLRNYATVGPEDGRPWSSKHLDECYRVGARRFGWSARRAKPRSRVEGEWLVGMGMATAIYPVARQAASARVELLRDDTAAVASGTSDMGTGSLTVLAIVGADSLGIPVRKVTPSVGDSALPPGATAAASGATQSTVPAIQDAAAAVIEELKKLAVSESKSPWHGADPKSLTYRDGKLSGGGRSMTFGRLLSTVGRSSVQATVNVQHDPEIVGRYSWHSFGAHFCEVRVNRFTGEPRVARWTTVVDVGRVVNAQTARSQLIGGVIWGIGHGLLEENRLEVATGRLAASNMADYMVPVNADIPEIDVHWLDRPDPQIGGLGARGLGELGTVGAAAAIGNAVFNATGIRVHETPITLDKLLQ